MHFTQKIPCGILCPQPTLIFMADITDRIPQNIEGRFFVDSTCIDCDQCRSTAPEFFTRDDELASTYVRKQPVTDEEIDLCIEAMEGCPTESIGG